MSDDEDLLLENLTPANIFQIAWQIRERSHDPNDARRLLHKFCELVDRGDQIPTELLRHLHDSFALFLATEDKPGKAVAIDTALGLTPGKRRSKLTDFEQKNLAVSFWRMRLAGETYQVTRETLAEEYKIGKTEAGNLWKKNKMDSLIQLRLELRENGEDLTKEQVKLVEKWTQKEREAIAELFGDYSGKLI